MTFFILFIIFIIILIIIFLILLLFYKFIFLRDPERIIPEGDNILAPADGKVVSIINIDDKKTEIDKGIFGKMKLLTGNQKNGYLICIMMNIFDVHVQRAPINGVITNIKYKKGKFRNAVFKAKELRWIDNENNSIAIETKKHKLKLAVIQIAGILARRINCFVKINQKIEKGQRIGNIVLGSMVCLVLPNNTILKVKEGEKVKAGETIIAEY